MMRLPDFGHTFADALPELVAPAAPASFPELGVAVLNEPLAKALSFDPAQLRDHPAALINSDGKQGPPTVAMAYAGHQFGTYVPRLGDGRAVLRGELTLSLADPPQTVDIHLKGSGPTQFSRGGDGFAVLGPMLREYLVSKAMHARGIPTSRSLAVITTGATVYRELALPGAVLVRVAASHIRVGTFQYCRGDEALLRRLADYSIGRHYPHLEGDYLGFYRAVIAAWARLVAAWMGAGFIHGVMNTDNITISGETIDYGPCAFLDTYDPAATFSSIDHHGRYAYANQPAAAQWNLARLGESLLPLIESQEQAQEALATFPSLYQAEYDRIFGAKLGLKPQLAAPKLVEEFLHLLKDEQLDFTNSFRALAEQERPSSSSQMSRWYEQWKEQEPNLDLLRENNPVYIPRNLALQSALNQAEDGDSRAFHRLLDLVSTPFDRHPDTSEFTRGAPAGFQTFCGT